MSNNTAKAPPADPLEVAVQSEGYDDDPGDAVREGRMDARKAAIAFVREVRAAPTVHGAAMSSLSPRLCLVGVDVTAGGRREIVNCLVRNFIAEDGTTYWRAEALTDELAGAMTEFRRAGLSRQRRSAEDELAQFEDYGDEGQYDQDDPY